MTLTREPSSRRASQIGEASSTRRPTWLTMRWQMFISCALSRKRTLVSWILPPTSMKVRVGAVDHDVGDVVARQQRLERAEAEHVVADVVEQVFLLGDRQHEVLDRDDLVDDVADFFARALLIELRQRREVDRLDQRAEDHATWSGNSSPASPRRRAAAGDRAAGRCAELRRRRRSGARGRRRSCGRWDGHAYRTSWAFLP